MNYGTLLQLLQLSQPKKFLLIFHQSLNYMPDIYKQLFEMEVK